MNRKRARLGRLDRQEAARHSGVRREDKECAYAKQMQAVKGKNKSNCPLCAVGDNANKARIYDFDEMDADHVAARSKGGDSSAKNCQMLCTTHNRAKGNR